MARAKLSADDQTKLVALYRESDVTATALADQFGVSNSTVSRILREAIPAAEYRRLSRQKRSSEPAATPTLFEDTAKAEPVTSPEISTDVALAESASADPQTFEVAEVTAEIDPTVEAVTATPAPVANTVTAAEQSLEPQPTVEDHEAESAAEADPVPELTPAPLRPKPVKRVLAPIEAAATIAADPVVTELDADDDTDDDEAPSFPPGLDFTPEDDDEDDEDDDSDSSDEDTSPEELVSVEVQSLEGFDYPDLGYTLIDKYQELVTSPLSAFVEQAPPELANAITLPVFDTHRGARRYSHQVRGKQNKYRVLTFPGNYLERTRVYLQAKGITHVIMNHQVYEL